MTSTIAIISTKKAQYSETFIKQHVDLLTGNKIFYYGGLFPTTLDNAGSIYDQYLPTKAISHIVKKVFYPQFQQREYYLYKSFKKQNVKLVLAEYGPVGAGVRKICEKLEIPLIVHFHGADAFEHEILEKHTAGYKLMFDYASYIIVVSEPMRRQLIALGCPEKKIVKNIYGPDPAFEQIKPVPVSKKLVSIGRFVDKKAPYYTILAFAKTLPHHPTAVLHLVGNGPLMNSCRNLVNHMGLQDKVIFEGVLTPQKIRQLLVTAYAYVQHSIIAESGDSEGCPVAIIEASAAGLPVVATRHAGIPEAIIENQTGLLVNEHDVTAMSEKLNFLLADEKKARQLGEAGKKWIMENFSLKKHIEKIDELIVKCLS